MTWPALVIEISYFAVLSMLALYGLHRLSLVWIFLKHRRPPADPGPGSGRAAGPTGPTGPCDGGGAAAPESWPRVTVQLPIYDEYYVVERLIDAACALRYPEGRLQIQVLDDSGDATAALAARLVASYRARGRDIHHVRRDHRRGYKAGALAAGMAAATGDLIAVFDADFIPPPDFLERTAPLFAADARLGMAQARWGHINRDSSLLTRAQALLLDGHFVVEHGARDLSGRFLNFNGTAGIFRRACIEQAGGWQDDTLTEDLDLSYRAQLAGWRFRYLPDLVVPSELPVELNALKSQQRRWAKGSIQTALKLARRVLAAPLPRAVKIEAMLHLTNNVAYLLLAMLAVLIVPALAVRTERHAALVLLDIPLFLAGTGSFAVFCATAQREIRRDWWRALAYLPALMSIGIGLCLNNALAVIGALRGSPSAFQRTPKYRIAAASAAAPVPWRALTYRAPRSWLVAAETAFAIWFAAAVAAAFRQGRYATLPFLLLFASGFAYVTLVTAAQEVSRALTPWSGRPEEAPAP